MLRNFFFFFFFFFFLNFFFFFNSHNLHVITNARKLLEEEKTCGQSYDRKEMVWEITENNICKNVNIFFKNNNNNKKLSFLMTTLTTISLTGCCT